MLQQEQVQKLRVAIRDLKLSLDKSNELHSDEPAQTTSSASTMAPTAAIAKKQLQQKIDTIDTKIVSSLSFGKTGTDNSSTSSSSPLLIDCLLQSSASSLRHFLSQASSGTSLSSLFIDLLVHPSFDIVIATTNLISTIAGMASDNDDDGDPSAGAESSSCNPSQMILESIRSEGGWMTLMNSVFRVARSQIFDVSDPNRTHSSEFICEKLILPDGEANLIESTFKIFTTVLTCQAVDPAFLWSVLEFTTKILHRMTRDFFVTSSASSVNRLAFFSLSDNKQQQHSDLPEDITLLLDCSVFSQQQEDVISSGLELLFTIIENYSLAASSSESLPQQQEATLHLLLETLFSLIESGVSLYLYPSGSAAEVLKTLPLANNNEDGLPLTPLDLTCVETTLADATSILKGLVSDFSASSKNGDKFLQLLLQSNKSTKLLVQMLKTFVSKPGKVPENGLFLVGEYNRCREIRNCCFTVLAEQTSAAAKHVREVANNVKSEETISTINAFCFTLVSSGILAIFVPCVSTFALEKAVPTRRERAEDDTEEVRLQIPTEDLEGLLENSVEPLLALRALIEEFHFVVEQSDGSDELVGTIKARVLGKYEQSNLLRLVSETAAMYKNYLVEERNRLQDAHEALALVDEALLKL